jgi:hypothetical protein
MAMDPKQERALRDGTASEADQPRDTDLRSVREQAENPPVTERRMSRKRTAAVADVRVNQESGTPVDQMAREIGGEPVPEMGRAPRNNKSNGDDPGGRKADRAETDSVGQRGGPATTGVQGDDEPTTGAKSADTVAPREARRTLKARREHSKGDGNFPAPEPSAELVDEKPEDRSPRDLPKSRDDRSAPKGNATAGQDDRNPNLETRDDQRPGPPSRAFSLDAARDAAAMPNAAPRPRPIAEAKRAGSTAGQVKDVPGRQEKAEKPKSQRTPSMPKPTKRTAAADTRAGTTRAGKTRVGTTAGGTKRAGASRPGTNRATAKRATTSRATATRATAKRVTPKRGTAKRTGSAKRTGASKRTGAATGKRTSAKRPASRAKRKR